MMIEIEQFSIDCFATEFLTKSLDSIDPKRKIGNYRPDIPDEKCIFLEEKFANFGDTVQFLDKNLFCLNLFTELPQKASRGLQNRQAWMIFGVNNVKPIKRGVKCEMYGNIIVSMQNYLLELEDNKNSGYIQFYSTPDIVRCDGVLYEKNSIMHVAVYRNLKSCRISPSVIMAKPDDSSDNLYVAILPQQRLQIMTPANASVDCSTTKLKIISVDEKTLCSTDRLVCTTLECTQLLDRGEIITIAVGKKKQQTIWLTGTVMSSKNDFYAIFNKPAKKTNLICHNMAGFAIKDDANPNWIIDNFAEINQDEVGTVVTFTKPQKSVSIEQSEGYWWLNISQAHVLDAVI